MNGNYKYIALLTLFFSCSDSVQVSETLDRKPAIVPDYADITIPANIAPLNFSLKDSFCRTPVSRWK